MARPLQITTEVIEAFSRQRPIYKMVVLRKIQFKVFKIFLTNESKTHLKIIYF